MSLHIVVGGQFGSEAKGAATAAICDDAVQSGQEVTVVRTGGPNAGHSAADQKGRVWALRQVPAGMVVSDMVQGVIASGSEIEPTVLEDEISMLEEAGFEIRERLTVSDAATIIEPQHSQRELSLVTDIGSTGKGIGAARADRIMRLAKTASETGVDPDILAAANALEKRLNNAAREPGSTVVIEGTQGYGLGLHTGFYPQVTSADCRAIDVCAQAGINPWGVGVGLQIHVVVRPYPIRVAGNSGPLFAETTWEDLGQTPELTTVTKKVRRVGLYDAALVDEAVQANSPLASLAVSMVDKIDGAVDGDGQLTDVGTQFLVDLEHRHGVPVMWVGTGPLLSDWFHA